MKRSRLWTTAVGFSALLAGCPDLRFPWGLLAGSPTPIQTAVQIGSASPVPTESPEPPPIPTASPTLPPSPTPTPVPAAAIASTSVITTSIGRGAKPNGAGIGDGGAGYLAYLGFPNDVAAASDGTVYVADRGNDRIRALIDGAVSTFAGGGSVVATDSAIPAASASFKVLGSLGPMSMTLTPAGDLIVVGGNAPGKKALFAIPRSSGNRYGKDFEPGTVVPLLPPAATPSPQPDAVAAGPDGTLYVADGSNLKVWAMSTAGAVSEFAGTGTRAATASAGDEGALPLAVSFGGLAWVSADPAGNVYLSETNTVNRIRMVCAVSGRYFGRDMAAGRIYSIAGRGSVTPANATDVGDSGQASNPAGAALEAMLNGARRAVFDLQGNMFFADSGNNRIRRVARQTGVITTVVGLGTRTDPSGTNLGDDLQAGLATLNNPVGLAFDRGGSLLIGDTANHRVRIVKP